MNDIENLKRRYLQALATLIDTSRDKRRWIPAVSLGSDGGDFLKAACHAAKRVGHSLVVLELKVDDELAIQHRVHVAYIVGRKQHIVKDCVFWAPDAAGRLLIVPREPGQKFRLAVNSRGIVERHAGPAAPDTTFGIALAARRLLQTAMAEVADFGTTVMSVHRTVAG